MGVPEDGYECYLSLIEYKRLKRRYEIISLIERYDICKAKRELELYKKDVNKNNKLHLQFILYMESRLIILENKNYKLSYEIIKQALSLTVPRFEKVKLSSLILSFKELFLIVECSRLKELAFNDSSSQKILEEVINYIESNECEELIRAKLYPKTVCLACKYWFIEKDYEKALYHCNKGIEYLQNSGKLYFIPQILENKRIALESLILNYNKDESYLKEDNYKLIELKKEYETVLEWENTIKDLFLEYNVLDEPYEWYPYYSNENYFAGEVIKKRRIMFNFSQEELANNICSTVTLSRIENGITSPHPKIARQLLKKLNLPGELYSAGIMFDNYEIHKLCDKIDQLLVLNKYDEAIILLNDLGKKTEMSNPINKQYYIHKQTVIYRNLNIIMQEEALKSFKEILYITIPQYCKLNIQDIYFTKKEIILLINIAISLKNLKKYDKALEIYQLLSNYYKYMDFDISNNIITYELLMGNFESLLGNIGEYDKSNEIIEKTLYESLKCRRGRFIPGFLYSLAWNMKTSIEEKREMQLSEKDLYMKMLTKSYIMSCIVKDKSSENFIFNLLKNN